jgi:hypothetical protein
MIAPAVGRVLRAGLTSLPCGFSTAWLRVRSGPGRYVENGARPNAMRRCTGRSPTPKRRRDSGGHWGTMHSLYVKLHYLSCGAGTGTPPKEKKGDGSACRPSSRLSAIVRYTRVHWRQSGHWITSDGRTAIGGPRGVLVKVETAVGKNWNSFPHPLHRTSRIAILLFSPLEMPRSNAKSRPDRTPAKEFCPVGLHFSRPPPIGDCRSIGLPNSRNNA